MFFAVFALVPKPGMAGGQQGGVVKQYPQSLMRKQLGTMHITGYCRNSDDISAQGRSAAEFVTEYPEIGNLGPNGDHPGALLGGQISPGTGPINI